jgi:hypothetical protein
VLNEPFVTVSVPVVVKALPSVQPPPTPLKVTEAEMLVPFVVTVFPVVVALKVTVPVADQTVPDTKDMEPLIANVGLVPVANVTVPAETVMSKQVNAPVHVTV